MLSHKGVVGVEIKLNMCQLKRSQLQKFVAQKK